MNNLPEDAHPLFHELWEIHTDVEKFNLFINKIKSQFDLGVSLPSMYFSSKSKYMNLLNWIQEKDVYINKNYNKSSELIRLYINRFIKTVACNNWIYYQDVIRSTMNNFEIITSKVIQFITFDDITKNVSEELYGEFIENWTPPSNMAVKTASNSVYFLNSFDDEYKDLGEQFISILQQKCECIKY